jgi:hypothetical protein
LNDPVRSDVFEPSVRFEQLNAPETGWGARLPDRDAALAGRGDERRDRALACTVTVSVSVADVGWLPVKLSPPRPTFDACASACGPHDRQHTGRGA